MKKLLLCTLFVSGIHSMGKKGLVRTASSLIPRTIKKDTVANLEYQNGKKIDGVLSINTVYKEPSYIWNTIRAVAPLNDKEFVVGGDKRVDDDTSEKPDIKSIFCLYDDSKECFEVD